MRVVAPAPRGDRARRGDDVADRNDGPRGRFGNDGPRGRFGNDGPRGRFGSRADPQRRPACCPRFRWAQEATPRGVRDFGGRDRPGGDFAGRAAIAPDFVGVVTKVRNDREFDVRIDGETYNVYLSAASAPVSVGQTVQINGERIGNQRHSQRQSAARASPLKSGGRLHTN